MEGQELRLVALADPRQPDDYLPHLNSFSIHLRLLCDSIPQQLAKEVPVRAALAWTRGEEGARRRSDGRSYIPSRLSSSRVKAIGHERSRDTLDA